MSSSRNDLEPTELGKCAYRGCGGWGYFYMNLTIAVISLYRNRTRDMTVMALSAPFRPVATGKEWPLNWSVIGKPPENYTSQVDGKTVAEKIHGQRYMLDLSEMAEGKHQVTLKANGIHTYFDLDPEKLTDRSKTPLAVVSTVEFTYSPGH